MLDSCHQKTVMIVAMKYDYGIKERGYSYEWNHFYRSLQGAFKDTLLFDFMDMSEKLGQHGMQQKLLEEIKQKKPDITIFSLFTDQFQSEFISDLRKHTKTFCFFHDDTWRGDYVKYWAPHFDAFTTSDPDGIEKYNRLGLKHACFFPFGVNENLFCRPNNVTKDIDVSFVGGWHPYRQWLLNKLKKAGVNVYVAGHCWPNSMLSTEEMIDVFQRSKISINISNSISYSIAYLLSSPRAILNTLRSPKNKEQLN